MNIFNERGCFGGSKPKVVQPEPVPTPAPTPQIVAPSEVDSAKTEEERRKKLNRLRRGMMSTIKTGAKGISGSGTDLMQQIMTGKDKLGS